jgi:hypothetical protein
MSIAKAFSDDTYNDRLYMSLKVFSDQPKSLKTLLAFNCESGFSDDTYSDRLYMSLKVFSDQPKSLKTLLAFNCESV